MFFPCPLTKGVDNIKGGLWNSGNCAVAYSLVMLGIWERVPFISFALARSDQVKQWDKAGLLRGVCVFDST